VIRKLQAACFYFRLFIHRLLGLPAQTPEEIAILKKLFAAYNGKSLKVFEWGSGLSTVYYSKYLRAQNADFTWDAVDNHKGWYEQLSKVIFNLGLSDRVKLYLKEFLPFWQKAGWGQVPPPCGKFAPQSQNEKDYINMPKILGKKFDVLIIDARFRRRCLEVAKDVLASNGVVVMHDAQKPYYLVDIGNFTHSRLMDTGHWYWGQNPGCKLWLGSMNSKLVADKVV